MITFKLFLLFFCYVVTSLPIPENAPCIPLDKCPQLLQLIETRRHHYGTKTLLRLLHCHHKQQKAHLKCVDSTFITAFMAKADLIADQTTCGFVNLGDKIAGGVTASLDDYPWIGLIKFKVDGGLYKFGCHANLISKKYLLTVAHCVEPKNFNGTLFSVILGDYDTRTKYDCLPSKFPISGECIENADKEYFPEKLIPHPEYKNSSGNDIALIRLTQEVDFTDFIKPICLPPNSLIIFTNETWVIAGWGQNRNFLQNDIKMKAQFAYRKKEDCGRDIDDKKLICAGSSQYAKTCSGDSGSPLMLERPIGDDHQTFLIGLTSKGISCSYNITISQFVKVSAHIEWILEMIEP